MKSQDILILFKIISLSRKPASYFLSNPISVEDNGWSDTEDKGQASQLRQIESLNDAEKLREYLFSVRGMSETLGISKSEVNNGITRCMDVNLAKISRINHRVEVNKKVLLNFIRFGMRLVFPVKPAEITRGIPTTFSAPVLKSSLYSAGDYMMVWPDPFGKEMGQSITPLYRSIPYAVRQDPDLYAWMALIDAVRLGRPREMNLALERIEGRLFDDTI